MRHRVVALAAFVACAVLAAHAQTRFTYSSGQPLSPAYEGWMYKADGSVTMYFGYMNTNWLEEFDIPVGPANDMEPGGPDLGQPTHFYPRRNPFLFTVRVLSPSTRSSGGMLVRSSSRRLPKSPPTSVDITWLSI